MSEPIFIGIDRMNDQPMYGTKPQYDYEHQAWTVMNSAGFRVYLRCGHPDEMDCGCYGREHHNEPVAHQLVDPYGNLRLLVNRR